MNHQAKAVGATAPRKLLNDPLRVREVATFADHAGRTAWFISGGRRAALGSSILPPLWSHQVYITDGENSTTAGHDMAMRLYGAVTADTTYSIPLRLDLYFLPGADAEACMAHYRAEKIARNGGAEHSHSSLLFVEGPPPLLDPFRDDRAFFSFLIQIEDPDWVHAGATLIYFDNDISAYYAPDEVVPPAEPTIRRGVPWKREPDNGDATSVGFVTMQNHVGRCLENLRYDGGRCEEMGTAYDERLAQGHTTWAGFAGWRQLASPYHSYEFRTTL